MATSKLSLPKLELITEDSDTRTMDGTADKKKPTKSFESKTKVVGKWKRLAEKAKQLDDPWEEFNLEETCPTEVAKRHLYNPRKRTWKEDTIEVKMQTEPFARGAMRECFRMKKLSKFVYQDDWKKASNYVAKRYMKEEKRSTYFEDVKLQMDAKLWGEDYNKKDPPKKVDIIQTYIIEMNEREDSPLYCVEHLIDGDYIKYNSNSGYVTDIKRLTPQAFSHFTFERSAHQLIVVDVQGVGDLYTDPQIHTFGAQEYGEANLGAKGMALFFSSHICSPLCEFLGLVEFDLSRKELEHLKSKKWKSEEPSGTVVSTSSANSLDVPSEGQLETVGEAFRRISQSNWDVLAEPGGSVPESPMTPLTPFSGSGTSLSSLNEKKQRQKYDSVGDDQEEGSFSLDRKDTAAAAEVAKQQIKKLQDIADKQREGLAILGMVHFEMANYNLIGRFSEDQKTPDNESAMFHLEKATECDNLKALELLSKMYLQIPHDEFSELSVSDTLSNQCRGFDYLYRAAELGDREAMVRVAEALETGIGLGERPEEDAGFTAPQRHQSYQEAVKWYTKAVEQECAEGDASYLSHANYAILAKLAELYLKGGLGLEKDPSSAGDYYTQAAEEAMAALKGKLATKYYSLAEEAWAEC